ncbi:MAG: hypothetical protein R3C14_29585 [Caldilineaceae bacterium]
MSEKFMGVQLGSHTVFDEGIDHSLNILQETAGINAVFVYSHMHHHGFATRRTMDALAHDHGVPVKDPTQRDLTMLWVEPHDEYYGGTLIRNHRDPGAEYADRDILGELIEPAHQRGVKVFARILEGNNALLARRVPNWVKVLSVDVYGRLHHLPCWNNPDYRMWWLSTVEDLFKSYDLDGFKYGAERSSPLSTLLFSKGNQWSSAVPNCFCDHCQAKGRARGINVERARQGFQTLYELIQGLQEGTAKVVDGVVATLWRIFLKYPEILAWDYFQHESKEEVAKLMYGGIKTISPTAQVGWHVYHRGTTWDIIYRAEMDYAEMVHYSDWIKPVVYHDVAGPRLHRDIGGLHETILRELSEEQILGLIYAFMGYDPQQEPTYDQLPTRGLSPNYVYRETKRCVDAVAGKVPVYAGVGFDIPWEKEHFPSDPATVYQATLKAFEAGAKGLVVSREYDEMRLENLRAVGRAVKDATAAGL